MALILLGLIAAFSPLCLGASECPNGETVWNCFVDPCFSAICPSGSSCVSNYCGGCNANCVCPDGSAPVHCFADPCSTARCGAGTLCVSNYCGGCNAECKAVCIVGDTTYLAGDSYPSEDGCNTCTCSDTGASFCTKKFCIAPTCEYDGQTHSVGDSFPDTDGCNTCTCNVGGSVACTEMACAPTCDYNGQTHSVGDSFPAIDGCNTCTCTDGGNVGCTKKACVCPNNEPYVACITDPCLTRRRCRRNKVCKVDNCGACTAKCVKP